MRMIEIIALDSGAHRNQTYHGVLPKGWAVVPDNIEIPNTFPFVNVTAEEVEGVMTVTGMTEGIVPEPTPEPKREPTADELINIMLGV